MKILSLHCDYITFKPLKKALKEPEELSDDRKIEKTIKEVLVILTAVEEGDNNNITEKYVTEIINIAEQVKTKSIVLYPYAHLSSNLGKPQVAMEIMASAQELLEKKNYKVDRAPFGYYKEFSLKVKGHPLSELSRSISTEGGNEPEEKTSEEERQKILKKLSKNKMSGELTKDGLKSNVELGKELDLFILNEVIGSGLPLLTPAGSIIRMKMEEFIKKEELARGYKYTYTPVMAKSDLYKVSEIGRAHV